ncbi:carbon-monoxide dehydrogenase medium subunit [Halopolyspora algeriensis]|uniref:Carbon-monoxide dehydrogenase medium subunit n=1 Tax=Halopolyspora algeriensis TaxID=1500506 RepID=A0A368VVJ8_9ACTN|nr:FAD binding domain-containing protein [Halopolyspora algeriensis]RCW45873.1 carbon-monoxide dehydrogenase medium subunit [Halopolyspora algeriensis]TQM55287.1 carbon-monoxide dehydrogenase medium subunit [Halopolyspora algeriensis]
MKPAPFNYVRADSIEQAVEALAGSSDGKVLAGGQSLIPLLSMRLAGPSLLVDINGIAGLDEVRADSDGVHLGALARHADVLANTAAREVQPLVAAALSHVGHATIRNRGTTVGSLVHADASAEMPLILLLLAGSLDVVGPRGRRTIPAESLYIGPLESSLEHDEVAVEAFFPALPPMTGIAFEEVARRQGDYALCGVGAVVEVDGGHVRSARAGFMSVHDVPVVAELTEHLAGMSLSTQEGRVVLEAAVEHAMGALDPAADVHASEAYRAHLARVLAKRVVAAAFSDATHRAATRPAVGSEA